MIQIRHQEKDFFAATHSERPIRLLLKGKGVRGEVRPDEIHRVPGGAVGGGDALLFVLTDGDDNRYLAQISVAMLGRGLKAIGFELTERPLE